MRRPKKRKPDTHEPAEQTRSEQVNLALLALVVGAAVGLIGVAFRKSLDHAREWRDQLLAWAHDYQVLGVLVVVVFAAAATGTAAWLVRRFSPHASGSGIPHVEAVLARLIPQAPFLLVPIKFVGGVLAMGAGLALGREGPSVQMGASIAHLLGKIFKRGSDDCLALLAGGAGAGLATAFNAPLAGGVFVLEELLRKFDTRTTIATFGTSAGAIAVSRIFLGNSPDFTVAELAYPEFGAVPLYLVLGAIAGFLGVAYNRTILGALAVADRLNHVAVEWRAAVIGAAVGLIAWFGPQWIGGGDPITQHTLTDATATGAMALLFFFRFGLGSVSYAAGTPGGLFAPLLVVGAQCGVLFGGVASLWFPEVSASSTALGVVGMAAFFTAVVRAPVTGIILVTEMTGSFTQLLPMLAACFTAMLIPTLLHDPPVYESLRERTLRIDEHEREKAAAANPARS